MNKKLILYRITTAIFLITTVILSLFLLPVRELIIFTFLLCILALYEWVYFFEISFFVYRIYLIFSYVLLFLFSLFFFENYFQNKFIIKFLIFNISSIWWILALIAIYYYPQSSKFFKKSNVLYFLFGIFFILPFLFGILVLRKYNYEQNYFSGCWLLFYILCLVWLVDSSAYVFGSLFGKHKLALKVSPKKTWEGFWSGICSSIFLCSLFDFFKILEINYIILLICSIFAALSSVIGDLTISVFKRESNIKDSSNLLPGHGGILDRIDSLLAAIPIFSNLLIIFKIL